MTAYAVNQWLQAKTKCCNSCASLAGLVLCFIACFILLVIAPLYKRPQLDLWPFNEPGELSQRQRLCHEDSTINITVLISPITIAVG